MAVAQKAGNKIKPGKWKHGPKPAYPSCSILSHTQYVHKTHPQEGHCFRLAETLARHAALRRMTWPSVASVDLEELAGAELSSAPVGSEESLPPGLQVGGVLLVPFSAM